MIIDGEHHTVEEFEAIIEGYDRELTTDQAPKRMSVDPLTVVDIIKEQIEPQALLSALRKESAAHDLLERFRELEEVPDDLSVSVLVGWLIAAGYGICSDKYLEYREQAKTAANMAGYEAGRNFDRYDDPQQAREIARALAEADNVDAVIDFEYALLELGHDDARRGAAEASTEALAL